ncbi:DUF1538 domain-containing protein [Halobacillus litoralis]|uniref:DUF1538 domain-containing protein n=1 Tax=Halobacillus litoralis TaxID=45668 RepID=UPI001CFE6EE9|nr:DUF1538 domain-containing protein [Halobacillus litoralis]
MNLLIFDGFGHIILDVAIALIPLFFLFLIFQFVFLKLPLRKLFDILTGFLLTFLGLALFLQGVHIGFLPMGALMGERLGAIDHTWVLVPIGFVLGFVAIYAEPAVSVLTHQVEKVSGGYIPQKILLYTLSVGVGISVALSMVRILIGIPIWYFIVPGYILALVIVKYSTKTFTSIAFDSGGVATGPMTATFILSLFVGIASVTEGRDPLLDGFGMVSLVALAPILSVLTLGVIYRRKERGQYEKEASRTKAYRNDR